MILCMFSYVFQGFSKLPGGWLSLCLVFACCGIEGREKRNFLLEEIIPHSKNWSFGLGGGPQDSWKRLPSKLRQCSPDQAEKPRGTSKRIVVLYSAFSRLALEMF